MKLLGKNIMIEQKEAQRKTSSGIITANNQKPNEGIVIHVGDEITKIEEGNTVLFSMFGGSEIEYKGKKYLMLKEHDILAIIK
tara:strand:- start:15199 stop:15447 length:249 start_codon:yes stop_codon:yes gene_type:complete